MNIQSKKQIIIDWISNLEDESIIEELKMLQEHSASNEDWWNELSVEQKESIKRGLTDAEEGRIFSYEQVKGLMKEWLTKSNSHENQ